MKQAAKPITWLITGLIVWILTVPLLSGVIESPAKSLTIIFIWLLFPFLYGFREKDYRGIGLTRDNLKKAMLGMLIVTILYSLIRNSLIIFLPTSIQYIGASAIKVAELLKQGRFGNVAGSFSQLFPLMFFMAFLAALSNELFYRGFLFTRIKQFVSPPFAILISALLFGAYHYFNAGISGLVMGVVVSIISGALMQKYNNVVAPALFHFLQYIITILVFYHFVT
jgi:membrane protease YdiL (CAAX protease family)